MKPTPSPGQSLRRRSPLRIIGRVAAWLFGVPVALLAALYVVLLFTPIPLPFVNSQVRNVVAGSMPAGSALELGDMALALEGYIWPVIQFRPVTFIDHNTGAKVRMDALEVGFSPWRALFGQPGATVTVVRPHIQVNQDLFGPRLASFEIVHDPKGGPDTIRVLEGSEAFPQVNFSPEGVDVSGELPPSGMQMRSDNDWIIYNLEAAEKGMASMIEQAREGRFSRLIVKDATLDMNDAIYGVFRTFTEMNLDMTPSPDGRKVEGSFSANYDGTVMHGLMERELTADGKSRLKSSITNLDLSAFSPIVNDKKAMVAIVGAAAVSTDVGFDAKSGKVEDGIFHIDLTGMDVRVENDFFPIATSIMEVRWDPKLGQFAMDETQFSIGPNTGYLKGTFRLGLDDLYGPVVSMSMEGRDVSIVNEAGAPAQPFSRLSFAGWSAPLYGATGIDQFQILKHDGGQIASKGRMDVLQRGMGFDMTVAADGISADDLKRLWPYFVSPDAREWFVKHVTAGRLKDSRMRFSFPAGTLAEMGETDKPLPKNAINIELAADGVKISPLDGMEPIAIDGDMRFEMHDSDLVASAGGATVTNSGGSIAVANVGFTMGGNGTPGESLFELSGDLSGSIPALVQFAKEQQPDLLKQAKDLPIDLASLTGNLSLSLVSTTVLDAQNKPKSTDYVVNGVVQDFGSSGQLEGHSFGNGQLSFMATQQEFRVSGQAEVDALPANIAINGKLGEGAPQPEIVLSASVGADDLKKMGFDASEFLSGSVKFAAKIMPDQSLQVAVDLKDAGLTIKDLGISKEKGVAGDMHAIVRQDGDLTQIRDLDVGFGDVKLQGSITFDGKKQSLASAEITSFALSPGDSAQISATPLRDGYQIRIRGDQLDLKPMLKRFFSLEGGSTGGPQATSLGNTTLALDVELKRALGFYKTTAFNLSVDLALRGEDLQKVSVSTQFGGDSALSITSNPSPAGKVMSVAFNDLGAMLRLVGVYPNIRGGEGSLVLQTVNAEKADHGDLTIRNFTIVDEANVAQIMNGHPQARQANSRSSDLEFKSAEASFIRRKDRVELTEAVLAGDSVGGTARGFIYTDEGQYDIVGTYVPMFGLNNVFGRLMGPLAGRQGEGLFGITFQVKGPLAKPDFRINPMSALAPGAFRRMFEFRQKEIPRVE